MGSSVDIDGVDERCVDNFRSPPAPVLGALPTVAAMVRLAPGPTDCEKGQAGLAAGCGMTRWSASTAMG